MKWQIDAHAGITEVEEAWLRSVMGWEHINTPFATISQRRGMDIRAIATYTEWNGTSCFVHLSSDGSGRAGTPEFVRFCFRYPFLQLKAERLTGIVAASNLPMLRLAKKLGFIEEARLPHCFGGGVDGVLFRMLQSECRWL